MSRRLVGLLCLLGLVAAGCSTKKPAAVPTATASPAVSATPASSTPSPAASPTPSPAATPSAAAPPPAGATARSITFISLTQAWVLAAAPGPVVLHTTDRGRHWSTVGPINEGSAGAKEIRFADASNGWAFNPGLYATHDGGAHWAAVPMQGSVLALEIANATAWALVSRCAAQPTPGCSTPSQLLSTPVAADHWTPVPAALPATPSQAQLVAHGSGAFVLAAANPPALLASTSGAFTALHDPCPTGLAPSALAGSSPVNVDILCSGNGAAGSSSKQVMVSTDAGQSFHAVAAAPLQGQPQALAAGSITTIALAAASGASEIYRTTGADTTWATVLSFPDGGAGWQDLGFTDATHAVVIHETGPAAGSATGAVYLSDDAGATWHTSPLTG